MADNNVSLYFNQIPSLVPIFIKAFTSRKPRFIDEVESFPKLSAEAKNIQIDHKHLKRYEDLCGFKQKEFLPAPYLHIAANPLMMSIITHPSFPIKALGLIHKQHDMTQHRPIRRYEHFDIVCKLDNIQKNDDFVEFQLTTKATLKDEIIWESVGTFISRNPKAKLKRNREKKPIQTEAETIWQEKEWELDYYLGQKYARISGDYNPIHIHKRTARLFGFRRHIAHGMWMLAHCAAQFHGAFDSYKLKTQFNAPVFLPSKLNFLYDKTSNLIKFRVSNPRNKSKIYVSGTITKIN